MILGTGEFAGRGGRRCLNLHLGVFLPIMSRPKPRQYDQLQENTTKEGCGRLASSGEST